MAIDPNDPAIQAAIAEQVRAILAGQGIQAPPPVRELTPEEKADAAVAAAHAALVRDSARAVDHSHAVLAALEAVYAHVKDALSTLGPRGLAGGNAEPASAQAADSEQAHD